MSSPESKQLLIIAAALAMGAVAFAVVVGIIPLAGQRPAEQAPTDTSMVDMLSLVHVVLFLSVSAAATIVPPRIMRAAGGDSFAARQNATIIRLALFEGAALFGCIIVLLAGTQGILPDQPIYYLNYLSVLFLVVVVALQVPQILRPIDPNEP